MKVDIDTIGKTSSNKYAGVIRIILSVMFVMTGIMKLVVPSLSLAFAGQLQAASVPFQVFNLWFVPIVELSVGILLFIGLMSRFGALVVIGLMSVATYVHLIVDDPSLFPLQPELPIIPIVVIVLSVYLLFIGGGSWSWDLKYSKHSRQN